MRKEFNTEGNCVSSKHFMVDTTHKLESIFDLIERGKYFTINRPRQFGKTTTITLLNKFLNQKPDYLSLRISFEGAGDSRFQSEESLIKLILESCMDKLEWLKEESLSDFLKENFDTTVTFKLLSKLIRRFVLKSKRKVVLIIDEIDRASNYHVFINFLALLRDKYLEQSSEEDLSFQSVILAGVTDIKHLKSKIRNDGENTINSPWNIAADFEVDLSFSVPEIAGMLNQYTAETGYNMDSTSIAKRIYHYTSGYPYLVSAMCKYIDEKVLPQRESKDWTLEDVEASMTYLVREGYTTTLFDDLYKNLNNNSDVYQLITDIVFFGDRISFNLGHISIAVTAQYGIIANDEGMCKIHNRIFEKRIYDFLILDISRKQNLKSSSTHVFTQGNRLLIEKVLTKFQEFMQENRSDKDANFLEREGRLLFLSFLKPILNGRGFDFKEPIVGNERRLDLVITFFEQKFVLELKVWRGEVYHQEGLQQLSDYLDLCNLNEGYLLIFDFRKDKVYKQETLTFNQKKFFMVWV